MHYTHHNQELANIVQKRLMKVTMTGRNNANGKILRILYYTKRNKWSDLYKIIKTHNQYRSHIDIFKLLTKLTNKTTLDKWSTFSTTKLSSIMSTSLSHTPSIIIENHIQKPHLVKSINNSANTYF